MKRYHHRIISIDFLRGLAIVLVVLVNNPGSWSHVFPLLLESSWNGLTPADCVFPTFIFLVGISVCIALTKRLAENWSKRRLIGKIFLRAVLLFVIGVLIHAYPSFNWHSVRIPGVLQRIALVYFFSALIFLYFPRWQSQVLIIITLLVGYYLLLTQVPVPGVGHPSLLPSQNLGAWLDNLLLKGHLWEQSATWDPEGLLGTVSATATGLFGVITGKLLLTSKSVGREKVPHCFVLAAALIIVGLLWSIYFPINKKLWTSTFVLVVAAIDIFAVGILYWVLDVKKITGKVVDFFILLGANTLFLYAIEEIVGATLGTIHMPFVQGKITIGAWIYQHLFLSWLPATLASFGQALALTALLTTLFIFLNKKKWVVSL